MTSDRHESPPAPPSSEDAHRLMEIGRRFAAAGRYDEAIETYLLALRIDPKNVGVKLALAEARKRHRQAAGGRPSRTLRADVREQFRRGAIDAAQFLGLAWTYADQGSNRRAFECLDIAEARHPAHPGVHQLRGRLLFRRKDYAGAAKELDRALRLNPFDRETAVSLGRACYEVRRYEAALAASVHAYLLLNDGDREGAEHLRRRIRTLKQMLGWGNRELRRVFHERQEHLHVTFDRLEWHREQFLAEEGAMLDEGALEAPAPAPEGTDGRLDAAARLRRHQLFSRLDDQQVFRLGGTVTEESVAAGEKVLVEGERGRDLLVVDEGRVSVERGTPYGTFALEEIGPGGMLGEVAHLAPVAHLADAVAKTPVRLLRLDAGAVDRLLEEDTELAVQVHWIFWRVLARRLRAANGQLEGFFGDAAAAARVRPGGVRSDRPDRVAAEEQPLSSARADDTVRLFREQGLSHSELITLATFSKEMRFPDGGYVFQEGDEGKEMYVVLEGRARISKYIPGGGEEALAIVGRGDFFGEMSMIDGEPRSADVRAHGGPLTVLALDQETVREVLAMDPQASLEFLKLLCRLITRRLREIAEKLIGWRILAGPSEAGEAPPGGTSRTA